MTPRKILGILSPVGGLVAIVAVVVALLVGGRGLGLHWDPFGSGARRLETAERRADTAAAQAEARGLEVEGAVAQSARLEHHHQQAVGLARVTVAARAEARNAYDAQIQLDPDRAARLRDHDRELCSFAPGVCGSAPADPSAGGADALSTGSSAGGADTG